MTVALISLQKISMKSEIFAEENAAPLQVTICLAREKKQLFKMLAPCSPNLQALHEPER